MQLPATKYLNNERIVSGTVTLFPNDVVLACDTSTTPCNITLGAIPQNAWSTQWKMYIYDNSNNASVNNITVNAGVGQTINGGASMVINSNNARIEVNISSNNSFLSNAGSGGSSSPGYGTIEDEGVPLPQRTILNFVGYGVTAIDDPTGQRTDIEIPGGAPYLYVTKNLHDTNANYAPDATGTRSFLSGQQILEWSSKVESGVTSFNLSSGIWTVGASGFYTISTRIVTRINQSDFDSPVAFGTSNGWMTASPPAGGFVAMGVYLNRSGQIQTMCSNKQFVTSEVISDINIDTVCGIYPLLAGDILKINILNKTNSTIFGFPNAANLPDCIIDFMAIKMG